MILIIYLALLFLLAFSKEQLVTHKIKISTKQYPLPISISSLVLSASINKIILKMGHLTNDQRYVEYPRGITAYLYNQTQLSINHLNQIKSMLMISQDQRFQIYLPELKSLLIADPNDRLCTQQIEHLFRYFFPCRNYAHLKLQKLINPSRLLQQYLTIQFVWDIKQQQIEISMTVPKQKKEVQSSHKNTPCGQISIFEANSEKHQINYQDRVKYQVKTIDKWYHTNKLISHSFKIGMTEKNSTIKLVNMLPIGFIYQRYTSFNHDFEIGLQIYERNKGTFLLFTTTLPPIVFQKQITFNIHFRSSLPSFEHFQTIAGGGQELMNVALFIQDKTIFQLHSSLISERPLEPDFSIPFQIITFSIGIIGYLWISLWRIHQMGEDQHNLQKKCI